MKALFVKYYISTAAIFLVFRAGQRGTNGAVMLAAAAGASSVQQEDKQSVIVSLVENDEVEKGEFRSGRRRNVPTSDIDLHGKFVGLFDPECTDQIIMTPLKGKVDIDVSSTVVRDGNTTCFWSIIGTDECVPSITCEKFNLMPPTDDPDDPCQEDYYEITDGSYGYQKFCGHEGPIGVTSGRKLRDFYITLKIGEEWKKRRIGCSAVCLPSDEEGSSKIEESSAAETTEDCNCGRKHNSDRIVGGEDAKKGEFPWMAALVATGTRKPYCGGSVINNKLILTAAHCFKGPYMKIKNINILLNAHKLRLTDKAVAGGSGATKITLTPEELLEYDMADNSYRYTVEKYFIHPLYVKQTNDFDVALIKLDKPIDFSAIKEVIPVCLPGVGQHLESKEGAKAIVAGWGLNASDATSTMAIMQKLNLPVLTNDKCKESYGQRFTRRMLCAGFEEGGKDSCKGDSGGPLISNKTNQVWEQIGIVSFGEGCADEGKPGVYVDTRQVSQWIRYISNLEDAVWCAGE